MSFLLGRWLVLWQFYNNELQIMDDTYFFVYKLPYKKNCQALHGELEGGRGGWPHPLMYSKNKNIIMFIYNVMLAIHENLKMWDIFFIENSTYINPTVLPSFMCISYWEDVLYYVCNIIALLQLQIIDKYMFYVIFLKKILLL